MRKLLLIDDEEPIRRLLTSVLEMGDFSVTSAASAQEGIRLIESDSYDVIVTDLRMESPLAGYEVVKAAHRVQPQPVTVILTAFPVPASEWRRVGADALLTKGGETLKLGERLDSLIASKRPSPAYSQNMHK